MKHRVSSKKQCFPLGGIGIMAKDGQPLTDLDVIALGRLRVFRGVTEKPQVPQNAAEKPQCSESTTEKPQCPTAISDREWDMMYGSPIDDGEP